MGKIKENVSLLPFTTFKIGGKARYFFSAKNKEDIIEALKISKEKDIPFFILGNGSNLLVSDKGFSGMIIKMDNNSFEIKGSLIKAQAGVSLKDLVKASSLNSLSGLEWAAGIPGSVGGAVRGNAGAFGESMADITKEVVAIDSSSLETLSFGNCNFAYRESIFKGNSNLIIIEALFELKKGNLEEINDRIKKNLSYRKERHPLDFPSAGSVFKNPEGFSAAKLISECGLLGKKIGKAQISKKHPNFIINLGGAKDKDVLSLIDLAKKEVKNKFGVDIKEEIKTLGF